MTLKRLIQISRPIFYLPSVTAYIAGVIYAHKDINLPVLYGALLMTLPVNLVLLGINDIYDRDSDLINSRKGGKDGSVISLDEIRILKIYIIFTAIFSIITGYIICGLGFTLAISVFFILGYLYSVPPIRLKTKPPLDLLCDGLGYISIFLSGYWINATIHSMAVPNIKIIFVILLFISGLHAFCRLQDYKYDKIANDKTIAVKYGLLKTSSLTIVLFSLAFLLFWGGKSLTTVRAIVLGYIFVCICNAIISLFWNNNKLLRILAWTDIILAPFVALAIIFIIYK